MDGRSETQWETAKRAPQTFAQATRHHRPIIRLSPAITLFAASSVVAMEMARPGTEHRTRGHKTICVHQDTAPFPKTKMNFGRAPLTVSHQDGEHDASDVDGRDILVGQNRQGLGAQSLKGQVKCIVPQPFSGRHADQANRDG